MTVVLKRSHVTDLELISRLRIGINTVGGHCPCHEKKQAIELEILYGVTS